MRKIAAAGGNLRLPLDFWLKIWYSYQAHIAHARAHICSGIEVVITGLTRNHVSTLEVQTAEKPVTMRVCGQVQIVNWGLFYPVVLPDFHGLNFAGKWL